MTSQAPTAQLIHSYQWEVAGIALLVYDTVLTGDTELQLIWRRKWRLGTVLYIITRYGGIMSAVMDGIFSFWPHPGSGGACPALNNTLLIFWLLTPMGIQALLLARIYAICSYRRWLVFIPLAFSIGSLATNLAAFYFAQCKFPESATISVLNIVGNCFQILFDISVFIITAYHTWRMFRHSWRGILNMRRAETLFHLLLRQGSIRFGIICVWAIVDVLFWSFQKHDTMLDLGLEHAFSVILICRFHLELLNKNVGYEVETTRPTLSSLKFGSILRHIGDSLDTEFDDHYLPALEVGDASSQDVTSEGGGTLRNHSGVEMT